MATKPTKLEQINESPINFYQKTIFIHARKKTISGRDSQANRKNLLNAKVTALTLDQVRRNQDFIKKFFTGKSLVPADNTTLAFAGVKMKTLNFNKNLWIFSISFFQVFIPFS